ncbi:unnamed protein product [Cuscuta europaea]|nr:unnamed protein product [Cuscuta europaea]CAH9059133.1 unnamed protein product [Cuscuta europaea]
MGDQGLGGACRSKSGLGGAGRSCGWAGRNFGRVGRSRRGGRRQVAAFRAVCEARDKWRRIGRWGRRIRRVDMGSVMMPWGMVVLPAGRRLVARRAVRRGSEQWCN